MRILDVTLHIRVFLMLHRHRGEKKHLFGEETRN